MAKKEPDRSAELLDAIRHRSAIDAYELAYAMRVKDVVSFLKKLSTAEFAFAMRAVSELRMQIIDRLSNRDLVRFAREASANEMLSVLAGSGWRTAAVLRELDYEVIAEKVSQADVASAVFILRHSGDARNRLADRMLSSISPRELMAMAKNSCLSDLVFLLEFGGDSAAGLLQHLSLDDLRAKMHGAGGHQTAFLLRQLGEKGKDLLEGIELNRIVNMVRDCSADDFLTIINACRPRRNLILNKLTDSELSHIAGGADAERLTELMSLMGARKGS